MTFFLRVVYSGFERGSANAGPTNLPTLYARRRIACKNKDSFFQLFFGATLGSRVCCTPKNPPECALNAPRERRPKGRERAAFVSRPPAPSPGADPHGPKGRGASQLLPPQALQAGRRHRPLRVAAHFPELSLQASSETTAMSYLFVDGLDEVLVAKVFFGLNELVQGPRPVSRTGILI